MLVYSSSDESLVKEMKGLNWSEELIQKYLSYKSKRERVVKNGRAGFKDSEQSKLYGAEHDWAVHLREAGISWRTFRSLEEAQKRTNDITKSKLWGELTSDKGHKRVTIIPKKNIKNPAYAGMCYGSTIQLDNSCGMDELTLVHELAHSAGNMHHGLTFRQDHVKLVSRFIGRDAAKLLKRTYREHGLKMNVKKKIKTPQEWLISYEKMMTLRGDI